MTFHVRPIRLDRNGRDGRGLFFGLPRRPTYRVVIEGKEYIVQASRFRSSAERKAFALAQAMNLHRQRTT